MLECQSHISETKASCSFRVCLMDATESYGRPSLVFYPLKAPPYLPIRVHLHGWTQESLGEPRNEDYDFPWPDAGKTPSLDETAKFWSAYGLHRATCAGNPEILIVPLSRGHNDDHLTYLTSPEKFASYYMEIATGLSGMVPDSNEVHLSVHSGGGKILAQILDPDDSSIKRIKIFDGIYDAATSTRLNKWLARTHASRRELEVYSVTQATYLYSNAVTFNGVKSRDPVQPVAWTRNPTTSLRFEWVLDGSIDHYTIVPSRFADQGWNEE